MRRLKKNTSTVHKTYFTINILVYQTKMERIQQQIKEQFHKAFYDAIAEAVSSEPPNVEYIVRLYTEIRDRLANMVKPTGRTRQRIHDEFDVDFFKQLLENNVFDGNSLLGLVNTTFKWIEALQTPSRDEATRAAKQRVLESGTTMAEVVPVYIREAHGCLDVLEQDLKEFFDNIDHPVVQEMLRRSVR